MALEMETNFVAAPSKLIPAHTGGAEFLAASHFTVSNDPRVTRGCQKSVFVHDYPPWAVDRPRPIPPLPPSDIFGADFNHFKANIPESKRAYQEKRVSKEDTSGYHDRLTATSFKIGGDNRLHNYATTHTSDYPMKEADVYKHKLNRKPQESFIPQGDPDKAANPMSDYKDRYRAHDIAGMDRAEIRKFHSAPTMKGDDRQHHFDTTHNSTFKPWQLPKIVPIVQQYSSNVPQGDLVHGRTMATTFQVDYKPHEITKPHLASATAALQSTHIKQGNGNWNEFTSTMTDSYKPVSVPVVRSEKQNNVSFVPQGDDDPNRNAFRACMTTHRIDYVKQHAAKPKLVSGANRDTSSQVVFGDPQQGDRFFETTHNATYTHQQMPERKKMESDNYKSSVPVDYYKGAQDDTTTYRSNYLKYDQARLNLNPLAIARMRESHIRAANDGFHEYSTEYTDQYLEKMRQNRGLEFDKDRLQKSSVPLGTMNV